MPSEQNGNGGTDRLQRVSEYQSVHQPEEHIGRLVTDGYAPP